MIRPCDECGGVGRRTVSLDFDSFDCECCEGLPTFDGSVSFDCERCEGMPKLKSTPKNIGPGGPDTHGAWGRGWFFPDPDTVMDYCPVHEGFFHWTNAEESFGPRCDVYRIRNGAPEDKCVRVWVAKPTPLGVVEEVWDEEAIAESEKYYGMVRGVKVVEE